MNDLVATPAERGILDGSGYLSNCYNAGQAFNKGDTFTGVTELVSAGISVVGAIVDPVGWLASSVAGWVLDHVPPLPEWLDAIAGDPNAVDAFASTWTNISKAAKGHADRWRMYVDRDLAEWDSAGVNALRATSEHLADYFGGLGEICSGVSDAVFLAARVIDAVRSIIRDLIADAFGMIISVVADCAGPQVVVLGGHAVTTVVKTVSTTTYKVLSYAEKLMMALKSMTTGIKLLETLLGKFNIVMGAIDGNLAKVADRNAG